MSLILKTRIPLRFMMSRVCDVITFVQVYNLFWRRRIETDLFLHVSSVRRDFLKLFIRIMFIYHGKILYKKNTNIFTSIALFSIS